MYKYYLLHPTTLTEILYLKIQKKHIEEDRKLRLLLIRILKYYIFK